ncbi:TerB family tellurite resistance protein [Chitinophagaceae bacterium LB-8]|uniref:TerB family tellurite resistance protein n=1 Tax=Paraflavisolibacter caeni TaxID=2982496 RepID=A0A9X3BEV0_9BACT|nr:TerB family tellurite resistance protein [Paraflavisolibacter caeni]MCU7547704.1 TerB family tellurite resistance protein [Paraflavisolibacter caeni]
MEQPEKLLKDYTDIEKGAYIGAIASIATADKTASEEELEFLEALADSAQLSPEQKESVRNAATELSGEELQKCLDILKGSDLRFSLITDLIAFAESDQNYAPEEKANIEKIAQYLNINQQQFSLLGEFVQKTAKTELAPEQAQSQGFLESLGLGDQLKNAGINLSSLTKGLLGVAGPIILAGLVRKGFRSGSRGGVGGLGGGLGGMLGGFGSLIGMLNGGRGIGSTGGLFSRVLRGF